jgi:hypothetical protein
VKNAWTAAHSKLGALLCPSIPDIAPDAIILDQLVGEVSPPDFILHGAGWDPKENLGLTHYQAVAGVYGRVGPQWFYGKVPADQVFAGIYTVRSKVSPGRIADGLSKQLAFGEAPGAIGSGIQPDSSSPSSDFPYGIAWIGTATLPTAFGLNSSSENGTPNPGATYRVHWSYFGGLHTGDVVLFVYADGSVHPLTKDLNPDVLDALSTIRGGETADTSQL